MPNQKVKIVWNVFLVILLLATALIVPFRVCFVEEADSYIWDEIDLFFDVSFGIDMLINFISAYYDAHNRLKKSLKEIALNYVTGWFWLDVFAL